MNFLENFIRKSLKKSLQSFIVTAAKKRVEKVLISLGKKELTSIINDGKPVELKCHFCNSGYTFTTEELKEILKKKPIVRTFVMRDGFYKSGCINTGDPGSRCGS